MTGRSDIEFRVTSPRSIGSTRLARRALSEGRTEVISPASAVRLLEAALGRYASSVIKCVFNVSDIENFHYTVVDVWTRGNPHARDRIYALREDFVRMTGWYPRSHGEPLNRPQAKSRPTNALPAIDGLGSQLVGIERAVSPQDGVSIRVRTDDGSILLDTGFGPDLRLASNDAVVLLSHAHADHSGAVDLALARRIPVLMSATTRDLLASARRTGALPRDRALVVPTGSRWLSMGQALRVRAFAVPHMPGAVGFQLTDGVRSVLYTGDICLHTRRHDFVEDLLGLVASAPRAPAVVLLEAEMFPREHGATRAEAATRLFEVASTLDEVVVVADYPEQALYCYLDLFHTRAVSPELRGEWAFISTPGVRRMMELLLRPVAWRSDDLDPFLAKQYAKNAVQDLWGESTFLYWSDTMTSPPTLRRIWITSEDEAQKIAPVLRPVPLVRIGRGRPLEQSWYKRVVPIDTPTSPWTVHSDRDSLIAAADRLAEVATVVLFHTPSGRVNSWATNHGRTLAGLSKVPIALSQTAMASTGSPNT